MLIPMFLEINVYRKTCAFKNLLTFEKLGEKFEKMKRVK